MHSQDNCRLNSITLNWSAKRPTTINKAKAWRRMEWGGGVGGVCIAEAGGKANAPNAAAHLHTFAASSIITH